MRYLRYLDERTKRPDICAHALANQMNVEYCMPAKCTRNYSCPVENGKVKHWSRALCDLLQQWPRKSWRTSSTEMCPASEVDLHNLHVGR